MQSADREPYVAEAKQPIATQRLVQPQTLGFSRSPPHFSCAMKTLRMRSHGHLMRIVWQDVAQLQFVYSHLM